MNSELNEVIRLAQQQLFSQMEEEADFQMDEPIDLDDLPEIDNLNGKNPNNPNKPFQIQKDSPFKLYKSNNEKVVQLTTLIPNNYFEKLLFQPDLIEAIQINTGAQIQLQTDQYYLFSNDEEKCFLIKILGTMQQFNEALKQIFQSLNKNL